MKTKIATLLAVGVIVCSTAIASDINNNVTKNVLTSFNHRFVHATQVSWSKVDNYVKASFKLNGQYLFAYFNDIGELMGTARNIVTTQLPINLQTHIVAAFPSAWVTELFEFATEEDTVYFITIENADQLISLKSAGNASWTSFRKTRKN